MKRLLTILVIGLVGTLGYAFRAPLENRLFQLWSFYAPCQKPIAYAIGSFDNKFGFT